MPTGYIIDYIRIYFYIFLKLKNIVFNYFRMEGSLELGSRKHFPKLSLNNNFFYTRQTSLTTWKGKCSYKSR
jgi:hypothetical protein